MFCNSQGHSWQGSQGHRLIRETAGQVAKDTGSQGHRLIREAAGQVVKDTA